MRQKLRFCCVLSIQSLLVLSAVLSSYGDDIDITFHVNLQKASDNNCFVIGQPLFARCGYDTSAAQMYDIPLVRVGFTDLYQGSASISAAIGDTLLYRYVTYFDTTEAEEYFFDYDDDSPYLSPKFKRKVILSGVEVTTEDRGSSIVTSHRMPIFPNPNTLSRDMFVTWECDMRPAHYALSAGKQFENREIAFPIDPITDPDSIDSLGVFINGTPLPPDGKFKFWRRSDLLFYQLFDDGITNGDERAGDSIYTIQFYYPADNSYFLVSHLFKMSINGGDNEGGAGALHMVNLDDIQSEVTVRFAWGEVDPNFYSEWDYDENHITSVQHQESNVVLQRFYLYQNYPNPFNPSTTIRFDLGTKGHIFLKIYNILGQEIQTLVNEELTSGLHSFNWKAPTYLPSGIYYCELKARDSRELQKMVLLR